MVDGCTSKSWMWDLIGRDRICPDQDQDYTQSKRESGDAEHASSYTNSKYFQAFDRGPISQVFPRHDMPVATAVRSGPSFHQKQRKTQD